MALVSSFARRSLGCEIEHKRKRENMKGKASIYLFCRVLLPTQTTWADAVTDWNVRSVDIAVAAKVPPPFATRLAAIVQSAVYKAVNAITRRYPSNGVNLDAETGASVDAAIAAANRTTLSRLIPPQPTAID